MKFSCRFLIYAFLFSEKFTQYHIEIHNTFLIFLNFSANESFQSDMNSAINQRKTQLRSYTIS